MKTNTTYVDVGIEHHTWRAEEGPRRIKITNQKGNKVCDVPVHECCQHLDRANAQLIAAAPRLLNAALSVRALLRMEGREDTVTVRVLDAAIELAETGTTTTTY